MTKEEKIELIKIIDKRYFNAKRLDDYMPIILKAIKKAEPKFNPDRGVKLRSFIQTVIRCQFHDLMKTMP